MYNKVKKNVILLFLAAGCCTGPAGLLFCENTGITSGIAMMHSIGARQVALGGSAASVDGDANACGYNPAGIASLKSKSISSDLSIGLAGDYTGTVLYGTPLDTKKSAAFAFGVLYLNGGKIDINYVDGTTDNVTAQSDVVINACWGFQYAAGESFGINLKYLSADLVEKYDARALAVDTGILFKSANNRFKFGLSLQNYGTSVKYLAKEEALPFLIRSGISYDLRFSKLSSLLVIVEAFYIVKEESFSKSSGLEYSYRGKYFARIGYRTGSYADTYSAGLGYKFGDYCIDWASQLNTVGNPHMLSFLMRLGK